MLFMTIYYYFYLCIQVIRYTLKVICIQINLPAKEQHRQEFPNTQSYINFLPSFTLGIPYHRDNVPFSTVCVGCVNVPSNALSCSMSNLALQAVQKHWIKSEHLNFNKNTNFPPFQFWPFFLDQQTRAPFKIIGTSQQ